ncbi:MAG: hypothetical protein AAB534_01380 [Patescibacteria group bacterium]
MPPENIQNHNFSISKHFFRIVGVIILIVVVAFLISFFFSKNASQGLTETERENFLNQELQKNAVGMTDEEKQAFFDSAI